MSFAAAGIAPQTDDVAAATPVAPAAPLLGPAVVLSLLEDGAWLIQPMAGEEPAAPVRATPALAYSYTPCEGDSVLAIGQAGRWYVLGVLNGRGDVAFTAPGNLSLAAPQGTLRVTAKAVEVETPRFETLAGQILQTARAVVAKANDVTQWITGALDVRAGSSTLNVDGVHAVNAEHCLTQARKVVRTDGELILHG